jgi:serine protease Do
MKNHFRSGCKLACALLISAGIWMAPAGLAAAPAAGLPDFTELIDKAGPAVVNIRTTSKVKSSQGGSGQPGEAEMQEFLRRFFGTPSPRSPNPAPHGRRQAPQEEDVQRGIGSGFIISPDGYVLTNAHVIDGADDVFVTLTDKREFKGKVLGADVRTDVALLKIEGGVNLPRLAMGDSDKIRVGEWVIAIGSPFNLENTVTAGIISAKSRDTGDYLPLIQSDVAVNPGNSGGPLINMRGEVIGINSQIATLSGGYNGISFSVPIDEAMRVADQLKKSGKVTRGRIGVQISEVTKELAETLGLAKAQGVQVSMVEPGGPADKGGIKVGDIILKFNGAPLVRASDLPRLVGNTALGSRATVTVWRKGAQQDIAVTIVELDSDKSAKKPAPPKPKAEQPATNALGLSVSDLSDAQKREMRIDGGVLVDEAEGLAARAGVRAGDVILQLNNTDVKDARQFNAAAARVDLNKGAALLVRRGETALYVVLRARG